MHIHMYTCMTLTANPTVMCITNGTTQSIYSVFYTSSRYKRRLHTMFWMVADAVD